MEDGIKKVMIRKVITCSPETKVKEVAKTMKKNNIGCLVVVEKNFPVGIITKKDFIFKVVTNNLDTEKTPAKKIMTSPVKTINLNEKIYHASNIMQKMKIEKLPVIDKGKLVGIVSQTDIMKYFTEIQTKLAIDKFSKSIKSA